MFQYVPDFYPVLFRSITSTHTLAYHSVTLLQIRDVFATCWVSVLRCQFAKNTLTQIAYISQCGRLEHWRKWFCYVVFHLPLVPAKRWNLCASFLSFAATQTSKLRHGNSFQSCATCIPIYVHGGNAAFL